VRGVGDGFDGRGVNLVGEVLCLEENFELFSFIACPEAQRA
jgi:hypothetical protein